MDIDWDKAPEFATHYCKLAAGFRGHGDSLCSHCIPRPPKKAQEVEWVDGLPPVGCECEYRLGESVNWFPCRIKAVAKNQGAIIECGCEFGEQYVSLHGGQPVEFRPIRTKQQRLRDELVECIAATPRKPLKEIDGYDIADHLISEGWTKEPKP